MRKKLYTEFVNFQFRDSYGQTRSIRVREINLQKAEELIQSFFGSLKLTIIHIPTKKFCNVNVVMSYNNGLGEGSSKTVSLYGLDSNTAYQYFTDYLNQFRNGGN